MSPLQKPLEAYPTADFANTPVPPIGAEGEETSPAAAREAAPPEVAALDFLDASAVRVEKPFAYPFRLDGLEVRSFTARKLTLAEVGALVAGAKAEGDIDAMEFYAAMTGLPAPVIRGLVSEDGELLVDTCYPFLPPAVQAVISLLSHGSGDASA